MYDPAVARWWAVDILAEKYVEQTPYNYVLGRVTVGIDPSGKSCAGCMNEEGKIGRKPKEELDNHSTTPPCICGNANKDGGTDWIRNKKTGEISWDGNVKSSTDIKDTDTYEYFRKDGATYPSIYGEVTLHTKGIWTYSDPLKAASNFNATLTPTESVAVNNVGTLLGVMELNSFEALKKLNRLRDMNTMKAAYESRYFTPALEKELSVRAGLASKLGTFGQIAGRGFALYGAVTTVGDVLTGRKSMGRGAADLVMTAVGVYGGLPGLVISGVYFVGTTIYDLSKQP